MSSVYINPRPLLQVEKTGAQGLGNCYRATYVKITSLKKISESKIKEMYSLGLLHGGGQEFYIHSQCDGKEEATGHDEVFSIDSETGERAINKYSGEVNKALLYPYYEYNVEYRVDSGG